MKQSLNDAVNTIIREIHNASLEDLRELPDKIDRVLKEIRWKRDVLQEELENLYKDDDPDEPWWNK